MKQYSLIKSIILLFSFALLSSCGESSGVKKVRKEIEAYSDYTRSLVEEFLQNSAELKQNEPKASALYFEVQDSVLAKTGRIQALISELDPKSGVYAELLNHWLEADIRMLEHQRDLRVIVLHQQRNDLRARLEFVDPEDLSPEVLELTEKLESYDLKIEAVIEQFDGRILDLKSNPEYLLN
jgi:hypothetical protein